MKLNKNLENHYITKPHIELWEKYSIKQKNLPFIFDNCQLQLSIITQEVRQFVASWIINTKQNVDFIEEKAKKSMYYLLCEDIFKCLCVCTIKNFIELSDLKMDYKTLMMLNEINNETDIETNIDIESNLKSNRPLFLINYLKEKLIEEQKQFVLNNINTIKSHFWYFFQKDYSNILTLLILNYKDNEDIKTLWENQDTLECVLLSPSYWAISYDEYGEDYPKIKNFILSIINKEANALNFEKIKNLSNEINLWKDYNDRLLKENNSFKESEEIFNFIMAKKPIVFHGTLQDLAIKTKELQNQFNFRTLIDSAKFVCNTYIIADQKGKSKKVTVDKILEANKRVKKPR